jgi:hypothetical protein
VIDNTEKPGDETGLNGKVRRRTARLSVIGIRDTKTRTCKSTAALTSTSAEGRHTSLDILLERNGH